MNRYFMLGLIAAVLVVAATAAKPDTISYVVPSNGHASVAIPEKAAEVAPGVFSLGAAEYEGQLVEGYAIVRYKDGHGKPTECNNDGKCQGWEGPGCGDCEGSSAPEPDDSKCYEFLAREAKWRSVEPYLVNPANSQGMGELELFSNFALDVAKWEDAAGQEIVGAGYMTTEQLLADTAQPDGLNEVYFGSIDDPGAIAITIVWGVFSGPPQARELVEWDQVYDQADFGWSMDGNASMMDFESIATHELGHTVGMGDLYDDACSAQTMYGYATEGETHKRSLEGGDMAGIQALYK